MLMWVGCQPSPSPPGVGTQPMARNLFLGEKEQSKGSGCVTAAGALAGASVSHRCSGAVAPPCFHHTPLGQRPARLSVSAPRKGHMKGHRDVDTRHVPESNDLQIWAGGPCQGLWLQESQRWVTALGFPFKDNDTEMSFL